MSDSQITGLIQKLVEFRDERDWKQFRNLKDLAAALSIEAAELQGLFLWRQPENLNLCPEES